MSIQLIDEYNQHSFKARNCATKIITFMDPRIKLYDDTLGNYIKQCAEAQKMFESS